MITCAVLFCSFECVVVVVAFRVSVRCSRLIVNLYAHISVKHLIEKTS